MQREFPHNTDDQIADYLARTLRILDDSTLTAEQWAVAFPAVYASVSGKQILIEQVGNMPILPGGAARH